MGNIRAVEIEAYHEVMICFAFMKNIKNLQKMCFGILKKFMT